MFLTSNAYIKSFSNVFNHVTTSTSYGIPTIFFTDSLFEFFKVLKAIFKNFSIEVPGRKNHRGSNQGNVKTIQRLPDNEIRRPRNISCKISQKLLFGLWLHYVETRKHQYRILPFLVVKMSPTSRNIGQKYWYSKSRGMFTSRKRKLLNQCSDCSNVLRCSYGLGTSSWFLKH